jgi:hypothetical protein
MEGSGASGLGKWGREIDLASSLPLDLIRLYLVGYWVAKQA